MDDVKINLSRLKGKIIAIDGPAGSVKSTTAKLLAARLGYRYLDTGAMYRALTWFALQNKVAPSDGPRLAALAGNLTIEFKTESEINHVFINGIEVTDQIRTPEITQHVSEVSAHKGVRQAMVQRQRDLGKEGSIVAEGRDTTTVVFPNADLKVYLEASVSERARRRLLDLSRMGISTTLEDQEADIERRDNYDSSRRHSPLTRAKDAVVVDTTQLTIPDQVEKIVALLKTYQ